MNPQRIGYTFAYMQKYQPYCITYKPISAYATMKQTLQAFKFESQMKCELSSIEFIDDLEEQIKQKEGTTFTEPFIIGRVGHSNVCDDYVCIKCVFKTPQANNDDDPYG